LYISLVSQIMSVDREPKYQAPATPCTFFWLRLLTFKITWAPAPAPQPWFVITFWNYHV